MKITILDDYSIRGLTECCKVHMTATSHSQAVILLLCYANCLFQRLIRQLDEMESCASDSCRDVMRTSGTMQYG